MICVCAVKLRTHPRVKKKYPKPIKWWQFSSLFFTADTKLNFFMCAYCIVGDCGYVRWHPPPRFVWQPCLQTQRDFAKMLQTKLDALVETAMIHMLQKNPRFQFAVWDHMFLCPHEKPPKKLRRNTTGECMRVCVYLMSVMCVCVCVCPDVCYSLYPKQSLICICSSYF